MLCVPVWNGDKVSHLSVPLGYRMWQKKESKLELAASMIRQVMPEFHSKDHVIIPCDSWYTKQNLVSIVDEYPNPDLIGNARSDSVVIEQFKMFGLSKEKLDVDGVIILMDIFALPYKAVILRLVESGIIEEKKARELLKADSKYITDRIKLTGKAERWQKDSNDLIYYGSLLENLKFNSEHDLLVNTREKSDRAYLEKISREFRKER